MSGVQVNQPLHDYRRSRAVLIGTWTYDHLPNITAAGNSLRRMEALLTGPLCDWPKDRLLVLPNPAGPGDLADQLITAFERVTDIALFYYVGHGQIDAEDELCMGLTGSRTDYNRRAATSLQFKAVRRALLDSPATTKVVILDCCFSGRAAAPANTLAAAGTDALAAETLAESAYCPGAYVMCASGPYTKAWYDNDPKAKLPQTYFTRYLADLLEAGIPGEPEVLRLDPLFLRLRANLLSDGRPEPVARKIDDASHFIFARNAALAGNHADTRSAARPAPRPVPVPKPVPTSRQSGRTPAFLILLVVLAALAFGVDRLAHLLDGTSTHSHPPSATASTPGHPTASPSGHSTASPAPTAVKSPGSTLAPEGALTAVGTPVTLKSTSGQGGQVSAVAVNPGHNSVAAAFNFDSVDIWRLSAPGDGATSHNDDGTADIGTEVSIFGAAVSSDGTTLALGSSNGTVYLVNAVNGQHIANLPDPPDPGAGTTGPNVVGLAFSANGQILAVGDSDGYIYRWNVSTRRLIGSPLLADPQGIQSLALSPDGTTVAEANQYHDSVYLWNRSTGGETTLNYRGSQEIDTIAFRPDGRTLAAGTYEGGLYLWNLSAKAPLTLQAPTNQPINALAFSPGGQTLAVGGFSGVTLWNNLSADPTSTSPVGVQQASISSVGFSPDSGYLVAGGEQDGATYLWKLG